MASFFTGQGDDGFTGILGAGRFSKAELRFEVLGTIDEASAALGLARAQCQAPTVPDVILQVQRDLYAIMVEIAADHQIATQFQTLSVQMVDWLGVQTDHYSEQIHLPEEFIVPGDCISAAAVDLARTVVRRAERRVVALKEQGGLENPVLISYLNRLSSLLYVLELCEISHSGKDLSLAKKA